MTKNRFGIFLLFFFASCSVSPVEEALRSLDRTIKQRDVYQAAFEVHNDSLRARLQTAVDDSTRWTIAEQLYQGYRHYSADSSVRYVMQMRRYAHSTREIILTRLSEVQCLVSTHDEASALDAYKALDSLTVDAVGLRKEYLARGIEVYTNIARFPRILSVEEDYEDSLFALRREYISLDTVSYYGRKIFAQQLRDAGQPEEAMKMFYDCYERADRSDWHELTSIEYNIAMLAGKMGDSEDQIIWLAKSAISDFKAPNRDFLSLYELARTLYNEGDIERANRYIRIHLDNVLAGNYQTRVLRSSEAHNVIMGAALRANRIRLIELIAAILVLSVFTLVILWLLRGKHIQNQRLEQANMALNESNHALYEANKIKDNYVFRYIDLSLQYLDKVEDTRHKLRKIAKNEGPDALLKELRAAANYSDYKEFYRIFDQTFLNIFPNFVEGVNALLREEARFDFQPGRQSLPTEIRILAAIKLGMDDSPRIASFLKCSLSTVYTYRAKMRNQALCPKEEFEASVKALG